MSRFELFRLLAAGVALATLFAVVSIFTTR